MSRSTCPGCGKTCTRTTCHACRYEGDPIPTIAEVLAGDARSFGDVRLDLYAQAVHDRARRELVRELRRRLKTAEETADGHARLNASDGFVSAGQWRRGYAQACRDMANTGIPSALRATRGR